MKKIIKKTIDVLIEILFPIKKYILLESSPDYSDNTMALFNELIKNNLNEKYKIIWVIFGKNIRRFDYKNVTSIKRNKNIINYLIFSYYNSVSEVIIDSNIYIYKKRKEQFRLHLGHGMPLKKVTSYTSMIGECDYILSESSFFVDKMSEIYQVDKKKILPLGYCRNDDLVLYKDKDIKLPKEWKEKKIIVWLPTYRLHKGLKHMDNIEDEFRYGIPCFEKEDDFMDLNTELVNNNAIILIKLHPAQRTEKLNSFKFSNIIMITDDYLRELKINLYQLLSKSSALITDYSSVYYDYTITQKPTALAISDLDLYAQNFGFVFDNYYNEIKGHYIYNIADLKEFIKLVIDNNDVASNMKITERYHDYVDGKASERVYNFLKDELLRRNGE